MLSLVAWQPEKKNNKYNLHRIYMNISINHFSFIPVLA